MRGGTKDSKKTRKRKYNPSVCNDQMTFQDCELAVLRQAVDTSEERQGAQIATSPDVQRIIKILEDFLVRKKLICYGGTAINNILPKEAQFYDRDLEVPDYDFFSSNAMEDAKELANQYYIAGYDEVEAKAGVHVGTFKVYVNFLPIADITQLHPVLYERLMPETITIAGIKYTPPNYLRMSMYLELSRPSGDVSRWEKVLKRINLLNKYYPLKGTNCDAIDFQRGMDIKENQDKSESIYYLARDSFIDQGVVFLGGYGTALYSEYMENNQRRQVEKIPDFDVLAENPEKCAAIVRDKLQDAGYKNIKIVRHTPLGEVIPEHVEISINGDIIALIYKPIACHSYNKIDVSGKTVLVATIDTMLSFYLAFLYANKDYFDKDRMLCMASYLFDVEQKNGLEQKGLLKRFSIDCYGKQPTLEEMRAEKAKKYQELKGSTNPASRKEFDMWFFKYEPSKDSGLRRSGHNNNHNAMAESRGNQSMKSSHTKTITLDDNNLYGNIPPVRTSRKLEYNKNLIRAKQYKKKTRRVVRREDNKGPYAKRTFHFGKRYRK
jgi:hypothetical protein